MSYDFKAWLVTKPDNEEYDYMNCQGKCAMGQYMKEVLGEDWSIDVYNGLVHSQLGNDHDHQALQKSKTFGELKAKLLELA